MRSFLFAAVVLFTACKSKDEAHPTPSPATKIAPAQGAPSARSAPSLSSAPAQAAPGDPASAPALTATSEPAPSNAVPRPVVPASTVALQRRLMGADETSTRAAEIDKLSKQLTRLDEVTAKAEAMLSAATDEGSRHKATTLLDASQQRRVEVAQKLQALKTPTSSARIPTAHK